ncbi:hypothetical protein BH20VER2_BH20VER2_10900 [soil metagenome]
MAARTPVVEPKLDAPIYVRQLPQVRLGMAWVVAAVLFAGGLAAWELKWRAFGAGPGYRNSDSLWAMQRRRIDRGEGNGTVLIGASRVFFDLQLPVWERVAGARPIQLAMEGTTPLPMLEDLADDPDFTGRLLVGIAPDVFFSGYQERKGVVDHYRKETPTQHAGQRLSMWFLEPFFAFYDPDYALTQVLKRQRWPVRPGVENYLDVRRLAVHGSDRNARMWSKVETDPEYQALAKSIWAQFFDYPAPPDAAQIMEEQIRRAAAAVAKLRARGVDVVFVRPPSDAEYLAYENRTLPRAETWDVLLARAGARGIHFEDHPELQGYWHPEWSHLSGAEADRFTEALVGILKRDFGW